MCLKNVLKKDVHVRTNTAALVRYSYNYKEEERVGVLGARHRIAARVKTYELLSLSTPEKQGSASWNLPIPFIYA